MEKKYTLGLYEKAMPKNLSFKEKLYAAQNCGFDFVELSIDETDEKLARLDYSFSEVRKILDAMQETGVYFRSMCLSGHRKYPLGSTDKAVRGKGMDIMKKAINLASVLGIRIIQLAGYDVYYEESSLKTRSFFSENLGKAVHIAASHGILLGFETMETAFMDTVEKAMNYVTEINSPYLGVYPDLGNLTNAAHLYKKTVTEDMEKGRGHVIAMHLKETVPGKYREIPFGTGHVDFADGTKKAWDLGVRRFVAEMWYTGSPAWEEDTKEANTILRGFLDVLKD